MTRISLKPITIYERLKPFQHSPRAKIPLPGSYFYVAVFPAFLSVFSFENPDCKAFATVSLPIKGPVKNFTAELDLERGCIRVWGESLTGYFRYHLTFIPESGKIGVFVEKLPEGVENPFAQHPAFSLMKALPRVKLGEALSLGNHRAQNWDRVKERQQLEEILPAWFALGQQMPKGDMQLASGGTSDFLTTLKKEIAAGASGSIYSILLNFFNCAFHGILIPRLEDEDHLGFDLSSVSEAASPLPLLTEGAKLIRELFIRQEGSNLHVLPLLPKEFHCGRILRLHLPGIGKLHLEWSKKLPRRLVIQAEEKCSFFLHFQKEITRCRLNKKRPYIPGCVIELEANDVIHLDSFRT